MLSMGISGSPVTIVTGVPKLGIYTTYAGVTTGAVAAYIEEELTGIGGSGVASQVYANTNVKLGTYVAAVYAVMDFETVGGVTGVASAVCAEMIMPGSNTTTFGTFAPLKLDIVCPASWAYTQTSVSFIRARASGDTVASWVTNGYLFDLAGMGVAAEDTPAVFHLLKAADVAAATHGLRILVDGVEYDIPLVVTAYSTD